MKILISIEDLRTGGAQTFALRLAQALLEAGHSVHIYCQYAHLVNKELVKQLAPGVQVVAYGGDSAISDWLLRKADGLLRRLRIDKSMREYGAMRHLQGTLRRLRPDVVNSHTIKADYLAALACATTNVAQVITMHGCYELFLRKADEPVIVEKGTYALAWAQAFVYLTAKNLEIFDKTGVRPRNTMISRKIYNGFDGRLSLGARPDREILGIAPSDKVFGMVARGIPEKGWSYAINSFRVLADAHPELHLVLVGASDYLTEIKNLNPHPRLHFTGFAPNPIDWVTLFDVGLLPSYFHAESLPNSIAEYLSQAKPVIASRIGEIPQMLASKEGTAGVVIDQDNGQIIDPNQLTEAMRNYLQQPSLLAEHQRRAPYAFEKFRMKYCLAAYEEVFSEAVSAKHL